MSVEAFLAVADLLPEVCLLVTGEGQILAANTAARTSEHAVAGALIDRSLFEVSGTPEGIVRDYLRACSRSRRMLPGSLTIRLSAHDLDFYCQGVLFEPRSHAGPAKILLRLATKKTSLSEFVALNERLARLDSEVRRRKQTEERLREEAERLHVTLTSIGEGVITTDDRGRVQLMNPTAELMTGWTQAEASGQPLIDIFHIINEQTRQPAENPCGRVLREGVVLGLANHTLLIARDGTERAIDDSAAPILDANGKVRGVVFVVRDVTDRRKADEARASLAAIVDSSEDAIVAKSLEGRITSWNHGAERMFGYSATEAIGQSIKILKPPDIADEMDMILRRIRRGEKIEHFETRRLRKDGSIIFVSLSVSPIRNDHGEVIGASKIARDITQRKHAEQERENLLLSERSARTEAEKANQLKDEFLATLSHEIRTPLNAILGWSQVLRTGKLSADESAEGLAIIERNSRAQAQLIDDLLDMSRIVSGKIRLEIRPVDLRALVESALAAVLPAADAKNIRIETKFDPSVPRLMADSDRLQQVIWNLLSNAIKFTPKQGRVTIQIARTGLQVNVVVADTGQGIRSDFLPFVFDRFRQADSSSRREHGGLGLGLAIVKQLVELHGGTVHAESPGPGQGATFRLTLPIGASGLLPEEVPSPSQPEAVSSNADGPSILAGLKIVVVDDDADSRGLVARLLQNCDAVVIEAGSVKDAFGLIVQERPDVLLSDIGMPEQDGYDLIRQVRALPPERGGNTPAAALTAFAQSRDRTRALLAGFQSHITKPIEAAELLAVVGALAGRAGR